MHGTLLYPLPGRSQLARPKGPSQGMPRLPKLLPGVRKRIAMWKRILLAELLHRAGTRSR